MICEFFSLLKGLWWAMVVFIFYVMLSLMETCLKSNNNIFIFLIVKRVLKKISLFFSVILPKCLHSVGITSITCLNQNIRLYKRITYLWNCTLLLVNISNYRKNTCKMRITSFFLSFFNIVYEGIMNAFLMNWNIRTANRWNKYSKLTYRVHKIVEQRKG